MPAGDAVQTLPGTGPEADGKAGFQGRYSPFPAAAVAAAVADVEGAGYEEPVVSVE